MVFTKEPHTNQLYMCFSGYKYKLMFSNLFQIIIMAPKRMQYTEGQMDAACQGVRCGMAFREAARTHEEKERKLKEKEKRKEEAERR